jgi:hypothetical protein
LDLIAETAGPAFEKKLNTFKRRSRPTPLCGTRKLGHTRPAQGRPKKMPSDAGQHHAKFAQQDRQSDLQRVVNRLIHIQPILEVQ